MTKETYCEELSNDPRYNKPKAQEALAKAQSIEQNKIDSGEWEWVQVDRHTKVLKRKPTK